MCRRLCQSLLLWHRVHPLALKRQHVPAACLEQLFKTAWNIYNNIYIIYAHDSTTGHGSSTTVRQNTRLCPTDVAVLLTWLTHDCHAPVFTFNILTVSREQKCLAVTSTPHLSSICPHPRLPFPSPCSFLTRSTCSLFRPRPPPRRHQRSGSQAPAEQGEGDPDAAPLRQLLLLPQPERDQPQPGGTPAGAPSSASGRSGILNLCARASAARSRGRAQALLLHVAGAFPGPRARVNPQRAEERGGRSGRRRGEALALPVATPAAAAGLQPAGEHGRVVVSDGQVTLQMELPTNQS